MKAIFALTLAVAVSLGAALLPASSQAVDNDQGVIRFAQALDVSVAVDWAKARNLAPIELTARYRNGDESLNTHYEVPPVPPLPTAPAPTIVSDYGTSISDLLADLHFEYTDPDSETSAAELAHLESVQQDFALGNRPITEMIAMGPTAAFDAARLDPLVSEITTKSQYADMPCNECGPPPAPPPPAPPPPAPPPPPGPPEWELNENPPDCSLPWWPRRVKVITRSSQFAETYRRYIHQKMRWTESRIVRMIYCHPYPQGYEADAPFNTNNGGTYLGPVLHWSSNFDTRSFDYLDTSFRDIGYHVWTVGIASTTWMRSGVLYHTHIGTANGSTSTDHGGIQGQVMQRFPSDCFTKWCMWPRDTKSFIDPWLYGVPHQSFITLDTT